MEHVLSKKCKSEKKKPNKRKTTTKNPDIHFLNRFFTNYMQQHAMGIYSLIGTVPFGHSRKINCHVSVVVVFLLFANKMKEISVGTVLLKMKVNVAALKKSKSNDWLTVTILCGIRHVDRLLTSSEEKRMV